MAHSNPITIGMLAHVDAGKTTLSEAILYSAGSIRKLGRVDNQDTFLDTGDMERARGITIFSKQAAYNYNGSSYTLLDTPGHVDFSAETERTLWGGLYKARKNGEYTIDDYRALPDEQRVELIDGYFYDMASPTFGHQSIGGEIHRQIANYIMELGGNCRPFIAPVDVQLDCDERTMVQPDVGIVCDTSKIKRFGIYGAPDFVVEVVSSSTKKKDYALKLSKYMEAGVREYWILDFAQEKVLVYFFESDVYPVIYGFDKPVPVNIYNGELKIDFTNIVRWLKEGME